MFSTEIFGKLKIKPFGDLSFLQKKCSMPKLPEKALSNEEYIYIFEIIKK